MVNLKLYQLGPLRIIIPFLCQKQAFKWTNERLCILGIYIGTNKNILQQFNYGRVKTKNTNMLNIWSSRDLTMIGKNVV